MTAETRYATSGEVFVAYQITGQDGPDLLVAPGFASHLEQAWESPNGARFFHGLGAFARLIRFDKRGTGLSDRSVWARSQGHPSGALSLLITSISRSSCSPARPIRALSL